jgi:uncharacterized protein (TIGR03437 family)
MFLMFRRSLSIVTLFLFTTLVSAGRVTSTYPLPNPGSVATVQLDTAGNIYLAGNTGTSAGVLAASADAFVAKLSSAGKVVFWTTFGGSKADYASAMAIASDGSISVIGSTASLDFPLTQNAAQTQFITNNQGLTGFFVRLNATGGVTYSSYLNTNYSAPAGSSAPSFTPSGIALDSTGAAYITGLGSYVSTSGALAAAVNAGWILKLDTTGKIVFATGALGGGQIALDSQGFIYVVGATNSSSSGLSLPVTTGAFQTTVTTNTCGGNAFFGILCFHQYAVKVDPAATKVVYATWISGSFGETPSAMAVDASGNVTVAGATPSQDYPVTPGAYQLTNFASLPPQNTASQFGGSSLILPVTGYVTKLNSTGSGLVFSTYLGGSSVDAINSIATDSTGRIFLGGVAFSPDFPGLPVVPAACRPSYVYPLAFATRLSADGGSLSETQLAFGLTASVSSSLSPQGLGLVAFDGQGNAATQMAGTLANLNLFAAPQSLACTTDAADMAPLSSVAPGQLLSLFGEALGPGNPVQAQPQGGLIPVSTGSVSVTFNGVPAPILYASSGQVNVQVPYEIAGMSGVTMNLQYGTTTASTAFSVVSSETSAFVQGVSYATCNQETVESLLPLALNAGGSVISCGNLASPGTTVTIFLNGLGLAGGHPVTGGISAASGASVVSTSATLSSSNTGSSPASVSVTTNAGEINAVWQAQISIPPSVSGPSLLNLTVNGVPVRDSLVLWLR